MELDGAKSADKDGTIVRYIFESGDGRVRDLSNPTVQFVYAPGDYRASLVVVDDQGAVSTADTRGFSVKEVESTAAPEEPPSTPTLPPAQLLWADL